MKKTRKTPSQRKSSRLTAADMQALTMLDHLVEEDRRIEQKYNRHHLVFCVNGMLNRLGSVQLHKIRDGVYVIAPPSDPRDLDSPALLLKVAPSQEEPGFMTPAQWERLLRMLSDEHCKR